MIITVTANPAVDKTLIIPGFRAGSVNRVRESRTDPGGKGINVSKVLRSLDRGSLAIGITAGSSGRYITQSLALMDITSDFLTVPGETRTNIKITDPESGDTTDINEPGPLITQAQLDHMRDKLAASVKEGDIVVLAGSLPAGAPPDTYRVWAEVCRRAGGRVLLDADQEPLRLALEATPYFIKPNIHELSQLFGRPLTTMDEIQAAAQELVGRGLTKVAVSMGGDGALLVTKSGVYRGLAPQVDVVTTVGAGDAMVAAFAFCEEDGANDEYALRLALASGSACASRLGSQPASGEYIRSLLNKASVSRLQ